MTFRQFVTNNVFRNKRLYAAYFLSSMFTVMVFFTFAIFAFHPAFSEEGFNQNALLGMGVAGGIIYVFSFFFVLYSMSSFLQSRKKEFGLLLLQGMSMGQIRFMVFLENMLIGIFATLAGVVTGVLFAKVILLIAENVLVIEETLQFYIPLWPIVITFISFILLFFVISIFVTFILRSKKLAELIKANQQPKKEPKASIILTVIAVVLLASGYTIALIAKGVAVVAVMVPVILLVIIGTYFLFTQLSVYIIHFMKKRKHIFWKKTNMILLSDLSFRMKDNARTFFMVAIISTVAFSAIGTLFGFQTYLTGGMKEASPYTFTYVYHDGRLAEQTAQDIRTVNELLAERKIKAEHVTAKLPYYLTVDKQEALFASESLYNELAQMLGEKTIKLKDNEIIGIEQSIAMMEGFEKNTLNDQPIELKNGDRPIVSKIIKSNIIPEINAHYIVSDSIYNELPEPVMTETYVAWKAANGQEEEVIQAGEALTEKIENYSFQARDYIIYTINKAYGPILFIGLFIGIVFFVSAGSFLYFRLYSDLDEDKAKFASIAKMGLTNQELKKVITRQTAILFFAPIIVALIHGAVALTALTHLFNYNLTKESGVVLGSFLAIQIIYFIIVRYVYTRQLKAAI